MACKCRRFSTRVDESDGHGFVDAMVVEVAAGKNLHRFFTSIDKGSKLEKYNARVFKQLFKKHDLIHVLIH